jgi:hypothetical protein
LTQAAAATRSAAPLDFACATDVDALGGLQLVFNNIDRAFCLIPPPARVLDKGTPVRGARFTLIPARECCGELGGRCRIGTALLSLGGGELLLRPGQVRPSRLEHTPHARNLGFRRGILAICLAQPLAWIRSRANGLNRCRPPLPLTCQSGLWQDLERGLLCCSGTRG